MTTLHRRLLRLETTAGAHRFVHLTDGELERRLRTALAGWLCHGPADCPEVVRAEVMALLAEPGSTGGPRT